MNDNATESECEDWLDGDGPRLFWHELIAMHLGFWFGRPFWILVFLLSITVPLIEVVIICWFDVPLPGRYVAALLNLTMAIFLFLFAWALTSFGTHGLTVRARLTSFLKVACIREYRWVEYVRCQYRRDFAESQKKSFVDELVKRPYSFMIFTRYVWRVGFVVLTIPIYLSIALLCTDAIPAQHFVEARKPAGVERFMQALQTLRDVQMGMLAGSSAEHGQRIARAPTPDSAQALNEGRANVRRGARRVVALPDDGFRVQPLWLSVVWEIVGIMCTFLYVGLALIVLPLQIGIVASLNQQLKTREFWESQLQA